MQNRTETMSVNGWEITHSRDSLELTERHVRQLTDTAQEWAELFPGRTWVQSEYGVPSLIIRPDCTVDEDGNLRFYEVEERPAGIGVTSHLNPRFAERLNDVRRSWPDFKAVVSEERESYDDDLWLEVSPLSEVVDSEELVLVRAEPTEAAFHQLESRSVSSIQHKGDKHYGVALGWWSKVRAEEFEELPWDGEGFTLKPLQGSKTRDVYIWSPKRFRGTVTRTKIRKVLEERGEMFCQPLHRPIETGDPTYPHMIYRIFMGFNPETRQFEVMGGLWMARNNYKVHGARDSVLGPLVSPSNSSGQ